MGCNCGGSTRQTGAQPQKRRPDTAAPATPRERREGGPQDRSGGYYSGPRRPPKTA